MGKMYSKTRLEHVSARLTPELSRALKRQPNHTRWVADLIAVHIGRCPCCGQKVQEVPVDRITQTHIEEASAPPDEADPGTPGEDRGGSTPG